MKGQFRIFMGIVLIIGPIFMLLILLSGYFISSSVIREVNEEVALREAVMLEELSESEFMEDEDTAPLNEEELFGEESAAQAEMESIEQEIELASVVGSIINAVLGMLGIVVIVVLVIGIPFGIYLLATPKKAN